MAHELQDRLMSMGPEQAQAFHDILHIYEELADQYGLWDAANIMMEGCSDDGFIDFRAWLIAQGREVYLAALKEPDSLADVEPYGNCCFESLTYVGDAAYRQLTGENINENADPAAKEKRKAIQEADITYREDIRFPRPRRALPAAYPRLCAKYGGAERFDTDNIGWNIGLEHVRSMLEQGKQYDLKKKLSRKKDGEAR